MVIVWGMQMFHKTDVPGEPTDPPYVGTFKQDWGKQQITSF